MNLRHRISAGVRQNVSAEQMSPITPLLRQATTKALSQRVSQGYLTEFLEKLTSESVPAPIGATATIKLAVWGKLLVEPDPQPWKYDHVIWGGPAYFGTSVGFMYTAYESWDPFFQNVTSFHAQGVDAGGGILQVNWFISDGTPVGQFNGLAAGVGGFQGGGSGTWTPK